ncbi:AAA family ATPase [Nocardia wallacei]|uniref:AAA family ATPase n=1 Tax=Nocardia wallacei TaxID=480035 RepID=UPI0024539406|nr:AAA family ATPase [Nocardia wallacei]
MIEGMPGSGKTSTVNLLAAQGHQVVGEYTTAAGTVIPVADHPDVGDDDAHEHNYVAKHRQATTLAATGPVFIDRDWLSMLAYAHSADDPALLTARAHRIWARLDAGALAVATAYTVLHTTADTSLRRRHHRLTSGHPWSTGAGLERLAAFYADPVGIVGAVHPSLARRLSTAAWNHLRNPQIEIAARILRDLARTLDADRTAAQ